MDIEELAQEVVSLQSSNHLITYRELHDKLNEKAGRIVSYDELTDIFIRASKINVEARFD